MGPSKTIVNHRCSERSHMEWRVSFIVLGLNISSTVQKRADTIVWCVFVQRSPSLSRANPLIKFATINRE
jgi:hypothetical protein